MTSLSEKLARLSPEQRKLVEARLKKKGLEIDRFEVTPRAEKLEAYPLTFAQERLWFLDQLEPGSPAYHIVTAMRFLGLLDPAALAAALEAVVERHEALRTTFDTRDDEPVQVVADSSPVSLVRVDLGGLERGDAEREARRLANEHSRRPFDLCRGPLLRTAILRLAPEEHAFLIAMHHIVSDGLSLEIFYGDLLAFYEAARRGGPAALPALPVQYADYALWQKRWLGGEGYGAQLDYWRETFRGVAPLLELPLDRPRPAVWSFAGGQVPVWIPPDLTEELRALSRRRQLTFFVTLLAAFQALLARWCGCRDVVIGMPVANRQRRELERVIGFFANTLVLRGDLSGDPAFTEILERARDTNTEAHAHQDVPFEKLIDELDLERDLGHNPLFQVALAFQATAGESAQAALGDLEVRPQAADQTVSIFDLSLMLSESSRSVAGHLVFSSALFDRTTAGALAKRLVTLLRSVVQDPERRLSELKILASGEVHQLLVEWNATPYLDPAAGTTDGLLLGAHRDRRPLHEVFADRLRRLDPSLPAVRCGGEEISYGELDAASSRLARHLLELGLGPEARAGILLERSIPAIVAILGILKAGGAYVPFDPVSPRRRLGWLIADSGVEVLVSRRDLVAELPEKPPRLVDLEADREILACYEDTVPPVRTSSENLAYVLYTSGSTGRPKGVACTHRGVLRLLAEAERRRAIAPGTACALWTHLTFDVSVYEIFSALLAGGVVDVVPEEVRYDGEGLAEWLEERRVASAYVPGFALEALRDRAGERPGTSSLSRLLVGVEPIPESLLAGLCEDTPGLHVINGYGPTEATVCATFFDVDPTSAKARNVPIGRRMPGSAVYLVDAGLRPVPRGSSGELVVAGEALARGYLGRPDLTAGRFVPDPFARAGAGGRLYRTGDLARYLNDGVLSFQGRTDFQVKLRGYRIEPGEIESWLADLPEVAETVVLVRGEGEPDSRILVAYVVPAEGRSFSVDRAREHLRERLPPYMVPAAFVELDVLPRTSAGKLDRRALPDPSPGAAAEKAAHVEPQSELEQRIAEVWREVLAVEKVGVRDSFFDLGGHSLLLVRLRSRLQEALGRELSVVDLFRYPTIAALVEHLQGGGAGEIARRPGRARRSAVREQEIAVVGMAGRFPRARDLGELWRNLRDGVEAVTFWSDEDLLAEGIAPARLEDPSFVKAFAMLEDFDLFDARLFGMSPREAQVTDPQHRLFLECAWEVLEDAGYDPRSWEGAIGVFGGVSTSPYRLELFGDAELMASTGEMSAMLGNNKDFLATRLAYKLDLEGPAINVQTACSTSLVATHLACRSLVEHECDMALAGGVTVTCFRPSGYTFTEGGILSPDGHCRPFDTRAAGTVGGNGVGLVALKRLSDALADGDRIRAVIRGSAINNDGAHKVGFTAPSVGGQAGAIREALDLAGVTPDTVSYVETHGTATALGDSVEVAALKLAFGGGERKAGAARCALGAIKSNVGHTDSAAGVAGLIKTVLALEHGQIPPTLHFEMPHPELGIEDSPFQVNTSLADWPGGETPRRAGVSSFGLGGTNAHAVLEEAPARPASEPSRPWQLVVLSAASEGSLEAGRGRLAGALRELAPEALPDAAHTLRVGRQRLPHRLMAVCRDLDDAAGVLDVQPPGRLFRSEEARSERPVAMLLPGLGDHHLQMGRELYDAEPAFRAEIDRCAEILLPILGLDLREVLYPGPAPEPAGGGQGMDLRRLLGRAPDDGEGGDGMGALAETRVAQPAVFATEYALARLWMEWGVRPDALAGYSLGEYTAACVAGVLSLEDALELVVERARLIGGLPAGEMLAVTLPEGELVPLLGEELSLAATNTPDLSVAAGPPVAIDDLARELERREVACQKLRTSHAFHSTMMEPIAEAFAARVAEVSFRPPRIPYVSNVTGTWVTAEDVADPGYWVRHLCSTVRFAEGLGRLLDGSDRILLEVGPGQALSTSARQHEARTGEHAVIASMRDARDASSDLATLLGALGQLWLAGAAVDWQGFARHETRHRVALPTYAFDRQRYWPARDESAGLGALRRTRRRTKRSEVARWFYRPSWEPAATLPPLASAGGGDRLVFLDEHGLGEALAGRFEASEHRVVRVRPGEAYRRLDETSYEIRPARRRDYESLLGDLDTDGRLPRGVVHCWNVTRPDAAGRHLDAAAFERAQERGLASLVGLGQALSAAVAADEVTVTVVADGLHRVGGREPLCPEKATLLGAVQVIPQEYGHLAWRAVSVDLAGAGESVELVDRVAAEAVSGAEDPLVAYHDGDRWRHRYAPFYLEAAPESGARLRQGGVYLLTGGLGRIGLALARDLARRCGARLVLTGRSPLPPAAEWGAWIAEASEGDPVRVKLEGLQACEAEGGEVLALQADVADPERMKAVVARCRERFGRLDGVFHLAGRSQADVTAPLEDVDAALFDRNFKAKVHGVLALEEALAGGDPIDFCVLFSSLASVLGGLGFTGYAAANAFLDYFAEERRQATGVPWISVNWDGWFADPAAGGGLGGSLAQLAMTGDEGLEALRRVLQLRSVPRIVVSTGDLQDRIDTWLRRDDAMAGEDTPPASRGQRPKLTTPYEAPESGTEEEIAELWQTLLGIDRIGRHDDYFELGGDSLLATQMLSRLRRGFQVQLSVRDLFGAPNVARLTALIETREQQVDLGELEALLERVEGMEDSEAVEQIAARGGGDP